MSLFEKLNNKRYDLHEAIDEKGNITPEPGDKAIEKSILRNIKKKQSRTISQNKAAGDKLLKDINKKLSASTTKGDQARSLYSIGDGSTIGTPEGTTATKTKTKVNQADVSKDAKKFTDKINKQNKNRTPRKGVDYFFDAKKAKKERDAFQAGRKAYTTSKTGIKAGIPTKQGIINYIAKARDMKQGTNANTKANKKAAEIIFKSSGKEYAEKIRKKYETDKNLPRRRPSNAPTYAQVKAKIDAKEKVMQAKAKTKLKTVLKVAEPGKKGTSTLYPGFDEIPKRSTEGRRIAKQFATAKQLTGEPPKPLTRFQKIKKAVTTGWKIPKDTGNFDITTRGTGKNLTKVLTRKSYKPNLLGTVAKNLDKVPNRYKVLAGAGLITYGLLGRNKTAKADDKKGSTGVATDKPKVMKYTSPNTTLRFGGS